MLSYEMRTSTRGHRSYSQVELFLDHDLGSSRIATEGAGGPTKLLAEKAAKEILKAKVRKSAQDCADFLRELED